MTYRATIKQIKNALKTMNNEQIEIFYLKYIFPWDKRSIKEIIKER